MSHQSMLPFRDDLTAQVRARPTTHGKYVAESAQHSVVSHTSTQMYNDCWVNVPLLEQDPLLEYAEIVQSVEIVQTTESVESYPTYVEPSPVPVQHSTTSQQLSTETENAGKTDLLQKV